MRRLAPAAAALILFAGCSFFSRTKNTIYSLDRIAPAAGAAPAAARGVPLSIDSVELPPGLDRREIVVRRAGQELEVRPNELWSASLQPLVLHTLAYDLASRLAVGQVVLPGETKPAATRGIDVAFEEVAAGPDNAVVVDAHWTLRESGRATAHHDRISIPVASLSSAEIAAGMSRAVAALADRIASGL